MRGILLSAAIILPGPAFADPPLKCEPAAAQADATGNLPSPTATGMTGAARQPEQQAAVATSTAAPDAGTSPIITHIIQTGAQIVNLGEAHGLQMILARADNQFMFFQLAPDGAAAVSGLQAALSVKQLHQAVPDQLTELEPAHGLKAFVLRDGASFQVVYATPDEQQVVPGVMWDANGENVTRRQVEHIDGMAPTVMVGPGALDQPATPVPPVPLLATVNATTFGVWGDPSAPRLWMFIDPLCPFSVRAMQKLQPLVDAHRVQLAVIPLSVIDREDNGESTKQALAMLSLPPEAMVDAWRAGRLVEPAHPEATGALQRNLAAARAIGFSGTPTFVYRKADGSEGRVDGLPPDMAALVASIGR
jgi:thiol:disulfide interchange protein DsbG